MHVTLFLAEHPCKSAGGLVARVSVATGLMGRPRPRQLGWLAEAQSRAGSQTLPLVDRLSLTVRHGEKALPVWERGPVGGIPPPPQFPVNGQAHSSHSAPSG